MELLRPLWFGLYFCMPLRAIVTLAKVGDLDLFWITPFVNSVVLRTFAGNY